MIAEAGTERLRERGNRLMALKIAFFDVDGTLWPVGTSPKGDRKLTDRTVYMLNALKKAGIRICMATGRGLLTMPRFAEVDFDVYMCFNGSLCFMDDPEAFPSEARETGQKCVYIYKNPLKKTDILKVLENTREIGRPVTISSDTQLLGNGMDEDLSTYFSFGGEQVEVTEDLSRIFGEDIYQMMLGCTAEEHEQILKGTDSMRITAWWERAADIIPEPGGKGLAVQKVLAYFGIKPEEAMAFGDGGNDIPMLKAVGLGVAMGNASPEVKAAAGAVCGDVKEEGIYSFLTERGIIPPEKGSEA